MNYPLKETLSIFNEISKIYRPSGKEEVIAKWLLEWAKANNFKSKQDEAGNIVIIVPGTKGLEAEETIVLQGHMDMVCQKGSESKHNFATDPIIPILDGDWLHATDTTLGADNGIGIAMALAVAESHEIPHKPLELLFTVDEEVGLAGASKLSKDLLTSKKLINLDSEEEGQVTIGCAGSRDMTFSKQLTKGSLGKDDVTCIVQISDGKGGHSGLEIHKKIANTNVLMARLLYASLDTSEIKIMSLNGGTFRNAIPSRTEAMIALPKDNLTEFTKTVKDFALVAHNEYKNVETNLSVELVLNEIDSKNSKLCTDTFTKESTREMVQFILSLPHGVLGMSSEVEGLVESSINLALLKTEIDTERTTSDKGYFEVTTMHRSSVATRLDEISTKLQSICDLAGYNITKGNHSEPWTPNPEAKLLLDAEAKYKKLFGKELKVVAIHAGLECGAIGDKYPGMEMISIGPDVTGAHTPKERLNVPSLEKVGDFLLELIK